VPLFLAQFWPQLIASGDVEANFRAEDFTLEPQPPKFLLELKGGLAQLTALLQCAYGRESSRSVGSRREEARSPRNDQSLLTSAATQDVWLPDPASPTRYSTRDLAAERGALARLQRAGFSAPDAQGRMQLNGQDAVLNFFAREFPRLQREWTVTLEERLDRSARQNLERIEAALRDHLERRAVV